MKGRTLITIAHRLSTIRHVDKTIVLKGGVVAEQGTHDELLRLDGVHAELYGTQVQPAAPTGAAGTWQSSVSPLPLLRPVPRPFRVPQPAPNAVPTRRHCEPASSRRPR